ncbi:MAG: molybdate transport repressor ModE-like protein [Janthinobacterium sp.]|jgi:molybdate transport repressor ModE-like protein
MYKVAITPQWEITNEADPSLDIAVLLQLLLAIQRSGSISKAAIAAGLSYRHAWGLLRTAEMYFGDALMDKGRGRGTSLTLLAEKLIWAERRVSARLSPILESLSSELERELNLLAPGKSSTIRLHASHGFAVAALLDGINGVGLPVDLSYRNSTDAVAALLQGECDLAGFHVPLGEFEPPAVALYAQWLDSDTHCLIHLAVREQGLIVAAGNPQRIVGLQDLTKGGVRFVNRQVGSGTRMLFDLMLAGAALTPGAISGYENAEFTHAAVAAYIASGMADVGLGLQAAAQRFGLDFIALARERYFLALPVAALEDPLIRQVIAMLQSASFRATVDALAGYDATDTGKIVSLADVFGTIKPKSKPKPKPKPKLKPKLSQRPIRG